MESNNDLAVLGEATGTELMTFEEELAADAEEVAAVERAGYPWISIRGKEFKISGEKQVDPMEAIILLSGFENAYYADGFDPDSHDIPDCYALAEKADDMKPHPDAPRPQHHECATCPKNQFGSADKGKGKACKNSRRLALMAPDAAHVEDAAIAFMRIPPTSLGNFSKYVAKLAKLRKLPPYAVISKISFDEKSAYPVITFECKEIILDRERLMAVRNMRQTVVDALLAPPQKRAEVAGEDEEPKSKGRKKF